MKKKDLKEMKELLLEERRKIMDHLIKLESESSSELGPLAGDPADIASAEISQSAMQKLGIRERKLLKKIDYALQKIEDGTYGICELTGEEIPIERLRVRPVALYTVEAKMELERRERGFRDTSEADEDGFPSDDEEIA